MEGVSSSVVLLEDTACTDGATSSGLMGVLRISHMIILALGKKFKCIILRHTIVRLLF